MPYAYVKVDFVHAEVVRLRLCNTKQYSVQFLCNCWHRNDISCTYCGHNSKSTYTPNVTFPHKFNKDYLLWLHDFYFS